MAETVIFNKIVGEGKALGYVDGRACFCAGVLPGETARVEITRRKRTFMEAQLIEVVAGSERRGTPAEAHFMVCSPWQGVDYAYQLGLKRQMMTDSLRRLGLEVMEMVAAPRPLGYRNKLEFALATGLEGRLELGFHERGQADRVVGCPDGCELGTAQMNAAARAVVGRLNELGASQVMEDLVVRANRAGEVLAIVSARERGGVDWRGLGELGLAGVVVTRSRAGRLPQVVWSQGATELTEMCGGVLVRYGYGSFFQVNPPMFERALERIVAAVPEGARVVDLYGGVGSIGLAVAQRARQVVGVEVDTAAVAAANASAQQAGLSNYEGVAVSAERLEAALLAGAEVVIVDPPRAGLHPRVIELLRRAAPERIVYLSCNPVTQARDLALLAGMYQAEGVVGFDFFPGILHVESLAVLNRQ
jgi:23S rRNA (uracil1939-C5)-methyltransferase